MKTCVLFACDIIHLVEVSHINISCVLGLETYLVKNLESRSRGKTLVIRLLSTVNITRPSGRI